ncbi:MAG: PhoH family protein [Nitrospirae bacterium]|nr:PhoH family protein [Nitrospirota bacterium]MBI3594188.1 PhoH family protein [Nitrospirota bacterium]
MKTPSSPSGTLSLKLPKGFDTLNLYGSFDSHLKRIELLLNVRILARGEEIRIEGTPGQIEEAGRVLRELQMAAQKGKPLGLEDINEAIAPNRHGTAHKKEHFSHIPVPSKKQIVPKSPTQQAYIDAILKNEIVIGIGPAGTGKTYLAMAMAVLAYSRRQVSRIILARPAVEAGEQLGFLPGDLYAKMNPYLRPLYDALFDMMDIERANSLIERGEIEIAPLAYMRGRTLNDAFVILDEAQNATAEQMKMFLTRLGFNSRMVVTGDITQVDLADSKVSGLIQIQSILSGISGIEIFYFTKRDVVRHRLVAEIIQAYETLGNKKKPKK